MIHIIHVLLVVRGRLSEGTAFMTFHDINGLFSAVLRNMFGVRVFISLELPHRCHSWMSGCGRWTHVKWEDPVGICWGIDCNEMPWVHTKNFFFPCLFSMFFRFVCVSACLQVGCQGSLSCSSDKLVMVWFNIDIHNESLWITMNPEIGPSDIQRFELWLWTIQRALHFKALSLLPASLPIVFSHFSPPCACGSVNVSVCKHRLGVPVASTVYRPRMRTLILGNSQDAIPNAPTQAAQLHCTTIGPCSEPYVVSWKMVRECQRCWKSLKKYIVDINGYIAMVKLWLIIPRHGGPVGSSGDFWCSCCYIEHHRTVSRFLHLRCHRSPEVPDLWRISWSISTSTCGRIGCLSGDFAAERNMILVMFHVPNYWVSQCLHFILISSWFHCICIHLNYSRLFIWFHHYSTSENLWLSEWQSPYPLTPGPDTPTAGSLSFGDVRNLLEDLRRKTRRFE